MPKFDSQQANPNLEQPMLPLISQRKKYIYLRANSHKLLVGTISNLHLELNHLAKNSNDIFNS